MPYKLESAGNGRAFVVSENTGKRHSRHALPVARAKAQMRALYANTADEPGVRKRPRAHPSHQGK